MENQFDNNYYGFEPQKPITEKPEPAAPQEQSDSFAFEPQHPFMQQEAAQEEFNPIRRTTVYEDDRFEEQSVRPPVAPAQPPVYQPAEQVAPPVPPTPPTPPVQEPAAEKREGTKVNAALVVVIITMGVLLLGALFGLFGYTVYQSESGKKGGDTRPTSAQGDREISPPDNGGVFPVPDTPSEQTPSRKHTESDFSDRTDKNYKGLTINDKPADAGTNASYNAENAYNAVSGSVVSVLCYSNEVGDNNSADSEGSGIVISSDGYVVTNSHLVNNSKTDYAIKIVTADGKEYSAGVVGCDSRTDLAVLKMVDAKGLKAATFGDSEKLKLGEDLIIIGNPGGMSFQNSMSKGIVSALNREASTKNMVKYIQTDAAINPGNSGGPAVNIYGQVVGVASAKIANEKYEGMGFCIPSAQVKKIVDSLITNGYVSGRVKIGISGTAVTSSQQQMYGLPKGILVSAITLGGPCDGTELKPEDVITALDGKAITSFADIYSILEDYKEGDKVKLSVYRHSDKKELEIEITLQADQ